MSDSPTTQGPLANGRSSRMATDSSCDAMRGCLHPCSPSARIGLRADRAGLGRMFARVRGVRLDHGKANHLDLGDATGITTGCRPDREVSR